MAIDYAEQRYQRDLENLTAYFALREQWLVETREMAKVKREMFAPAPVMPPEPLVYQHTLYQRIEDAFKMRDPEYTIKLYLALALRGKQTYTGFGASEHSEIAETLIMSRSNFQDAIRHFAHPFGPTASDPAEDRKHIALNAVADFFIQVTPEQLNMSRAGQSRDINQGWVPGGEARAEPNFFVFNEYNEKFLIGLLHELGPLNPGQALKAFARLDILRPSAKGLVRNESDRSFGTYTVRESVISLAKRSTPETLAAGKQALFMDIVQDFAAHAQAEPADEIRLKEAVDNDKLLANKIHMLFAATPFSYYWSDQDDYGTQRFLEQSREDMLNAPQFMQLFDQQLMGLSNMAQERPDLAKTELFAQLVDGIEIERGAMLGGRNRLAQIEAANNLPPVMEEPASPPVAAARPEAPKKRGFLAIFGIK